MRSAKIIDQAPGSIHVLVYGQPESVVAAIAAILPEPKVGTKNEWASQFYNTGVKQGAGTIWAWFA